MTYIRQLTGAIVGAVVLMELSVLAPELRADLIEVEGTSNMDSGRTIDRSTASKNISQPNALDGTMAGRIQGLLTAGIEAFNDNLARKWAFDVSDLTLNAPLTYDSTRGSLLMDDNLSGGNEIFFDEYGLGAGDSVVTGSVSCNVAGVDCGTTDSPAVNPATAVPEPPIFYVYGAVLLGLGIGRCVEKRNSLTCRPRSLPGGPRLG